MREAEAVSVITMTHENKPFVSAQQFLPKFEYAESPSDYKSAAQQFTVQDLPSLHLQCKISNVNVI